MTHATGADCIRFTAPRQVTQQGGTVDPLRRLVNSGIIVSNCRVLHKYCGQRCGERDALRMKSLIRNMFLKSDRKLRKSS